MDPSYIVYDDGVISVALFAEDAEADKEHLLHLGMQWLKPKMYKGRDGRPVVPTNIMQGETAWFLLPHSFGVSVGRTLVEQMVADSGLAECFNKAGFKRMVAWMVEMEGLRGEMCY